LFKSVQKKNKIISNQINHLKITILILIIYEN
jgi:hypothetical protein